MNKALHARGAPLQERGLVVPRPPAWKVHCSRQELKSLSHPVHGHSMGQALRLSLLVANEPVAWAHLPVRHVYSIPLRLAG